ncbi:MAG: hypothetical protein GVY36_01800 [Verrucomicrobia bacterium]|jgi:hypothetical protein|nr:hypothetical protein [Verrucomicrobiota bacterium]
MPDSNQARQNEVKVEDLLRLKRAERPDATFWNHFDRELHQRMLQTLVKKDPWYVQVMRGLTGRIAQTAAVGAAALLLVSFALRPADEEQTGLANTEHAEGTNVLADAIESLQSRGVLPKISDFDIAAVMDYRIETISSQSEDVHYTAEYSLDSMEVASLDQDAYVSDSASFALSGVATGLVY